MLVYCLLAQIASLPCPQSVSTGLSSGARLGNPSNRIFNRAANACDALAVWLLFPSNTKKAQAQAFDFHEPCMLQHERLRMRVALRPERAKTSWKNGWHRLKRNAVHTKDVDCRNQSLIARRNVCAANARSVRADASQGAGYTQPATSPCGWPGAMRVRIVYRCGRQVTACTKGSTAPV